MANKHEGMIRGFHHTSRAWYGKASLSREDIIDCINIGFYTKGEGGSTGEFSVEWKLLGGRTVPYLRAYDDSWNALFEFKDMLEQMAKIDDKNISPDEFALMLEELGIEDLTAYTQ